MNTVFPIDPALGGYSFTLDPQLTDAEFEEFCRLNDIARVERTREGAIRIELPVCLAISSANSEITYQVRIWWKTHRKGRVYDSSGGFYLPDGSMLSPDGAYCTPERLATVTRQDRKGFAHVCPDFVIELMSETDRLPAAKRKMELWLENGARVAWLVDPKKRQVWVYESGKAPETVSGEFVEGSGPVEGFRLELNEVWDCYED